MSMIVHDDVVSCKLPSVCFREFRATFTSRLSMAFTPRGNAKSYYVDAKFGFDTERRSNPVTLSGLHNSGVPILVHFCFVYQNSTTNNWRHRSKSDIKTQQVSHFPLLKNAQKQRFFVVGKKNKIAFKCLGREGHLKEAEENREVFFVFVFDVTVKNLSAVGVKKKCQTMQS